MEVVEASDEPRTRAEIRKRMRETDHEIDANSSFKPKDKKFYDMHRKLDKNFQDGQEANALQSREQIIDANTLGKLAVGLKKTAVTLNVVSAVCFDDFNEGLDRFKPRDITTGFDWASFGKELWFYSMVSVPRLNTMVGPLNKQEQVRKTSVRRRLENEDVTTTKAKEVAANDDEDDEATNERQKQLKKVVIDLTQQGGEEVTPFNLLNLMVYPLDPVQTIENFFDLSFMIKERAIHIDLDQNGFPLAVATNVDAHTVEKNQMVLSINMKDLRELSALLYPDMAEIITTKHTPSSQSHSSSSR